MKALRNVTFLRFLFIEHYVGWSAGERLLAVCRRSRLPTLGVRWTEQKAVLRSGDVWFACCGGALLRALVGRLTARLLLVPNEWERRNDLNDASVRNAGRCVPGRAELPRARRGLIRENVQSGACHQNVLRNCVPCAAVWIRSLRRPLNTSRRHFSAFNAYGCVRLPPGYPCLLFCCFIAYHATSFRLSRNASAFLQRLLHAIALCGLDDDYST